MVKQLKLKFGISLRHVSVTLSEVPAPLGIGNVELADGTWVKGFICEAYAFENATDISHFGGWRDYIKSIQSTNTKFKCNCIGEVIQ